MINSRVSPKQLLSTRSMWPNAAKFVNRTSNDDGDLSLSIHGESEHPQFASKGVGLMDLIYQTTALSVPEKFVFYRIRELLLILSMLQLFKHNYKSHSGKQNICKKIFSDLDILFSKPSINIPWTKYQNWCSKWYDNIGN